MPAEEPIRFAAFLAVFAAVALWELASPRRKALYARGTRWPHNLGLLAVDALVVRLVAPGVVTGVALAAEARGWGLLNFLAAPPWVAFAFGIVLLDLVVYFQHVMLHAVPALWRLHRVHHADQDIDVTTGTRFHPIEILLSLVVKCAVVAALGAPALTVLVFEVVLNATAMFSHANASLSANADRRLRWFVVTPDMHRVHHSILYDESSSNFGFNMTWWDRLFGTYREQPRLGHQAMTLGVDAFRSAEDLRLDQLLIQPFRNTPGQYPINRGQPAQS